MEGPQVSTREGCRELEHSSGILKGTTFLYLPHPQNLCICGTNLRKCLLQGIWNLHLNKNKRPFWNTCYNLATWTATSHKPNTTKLTLQNPSVELLQVFQRNTNWKLRIYVFTFLNIFKTLSAKLLGCQMGILYHPNRSHQFPQLQLLLNEDRSVGK